MDTLSHALWSRGFFGYRGMPYWSLFFGALPDLCSFGIYFFINLLNNSPFQFGKPDIDDLPGWLFVLYDVSHSLVIASLVIIILHFIVDKKFIFVMFGWPLHILLDFPFHTAEFFPTPILWPLLNVEFDGVSWATPYVWFSNIAGLIMLFSYRYYSKLQRLFTKVFQLLK